MNKGLSKLVDDIEIIHVQSRLGSNKNSGITRRGLA